MRRGLLWTLGVTLVLSLVASWLGDRPAQVVAAIERPTSAVVAVAGALQLTKRPALWSGEIPLQLEPMSLPLAKRDIFAPVLPPAPKVAAVSEPAVPLVVVVPPAPTAPAFTWRYWGTMVTPDGQRLVMLARGETTVTVQAGTQLDEGYVVEAVDADSIRLIYPPLGTLVEVPIPGATPSS